MSQPLPWWAASPSPFSIAWYCLFGYMAYKRGLKLAEAAWFVGFVALSTDTLWVIGSLLRFGPEYPFAPHSVQLLLCIARNVAGMTTLYLLNHKIFGVKVKWTSETRNWYLANIIFFAIWFIFAVNPSMTDWTYALVNGYSTMRIVSAFLMSHLIGRVFLLCLMDSWIITPHPF